jgi:hypothetical protein
MRIKWAFYILSGLFFLNIIGCHIITDYLSKRSSKVNPSHEMDEISCKAASAISVSSPVNGRITIAWDINTDDKLAGYRLYYGLSSKKYMNCIDIGRPTESSPGVVKYTLTDLERGKKYYIAVVAYDTNNNRSDFSSEISGLAE